MILSTKSKDINDLVYEANFSKKIAEFDNTEDLDKFIKLVTTWRNYLGIKDVMTTTELQFCAVYIKDEYSHFTLEMINLAIKLSLKGELKVDPKPYGAFSPLYISLILNAYSKYNDEIVTQKMKEEFKSQKKSETQKKLNPYQSRLEYLNSFQDLFRNGDTMPDINGIMWEFLVKNNFLKNEIPEDIKKKVSDQKFDKENFGQLIQLTPEDQEKQGQKLVMLEFFKTKQIDFTQYDILQTNQI